MGVRHEKVILSMEDEVSTKAARAAASVMLLDKSLDGLSGRAVVTARATTAMSRDLDAVPRAARRADNSINLLTGRLAAFRDVGLTLGPALNPVGGVLIAGVGGLANQLGVAALAGGSMIAAFQGVGGALEAVNKAAIEPTADNIAEANRLLGELTPAARDAVVALRGMAPALKAIRDAGAEALFPGVIDALDSLESRAPDVARIVTSLNGTMGELLAGGAARLSSSEWDQFFDFLATDARDTLEDLGKSVGFVAEGLADMWMAFDPLNDDFSSWALNASRDFSRWADSLAQTQGFAEFVAYIRETGPQVADTFGAMGNAILQIVQATAPLGGPALKALEAVSDVVASIADSDIGTLFFAGAAGLAVLNRTLATTAALSKMTMTSGFFGGIGAVGAGAKSGTTALRGLTADLGAMSREYGNVSRSQSLMLASMSQTTGAAQRMKASLAGVTKAGAGLAGVGLLATGAADGLGVTNTASLALMGTMAGPWGAAIGGGVGMLMDMGKASGDAFDALDQLRGALDRVGASATAADLATLNASLTIATEKVAALTEMRDNPFGSIGNFFGSIKQDIEDTFGAGDIEEAELALASLEDELSRVQRATENEVGWEQQREAIQTASAEAMRAAESFVGLGKSVNDGKVSLSDWLTELEKQNQALRDFRENAAEAAEKGLDESLIARLRELGPEGALQMQRLADATEESIERANRAERQRQRELDATQVAYDGLPREVETYVATYGMPKTLGEIEYLARKYELTPDEIATMVSLSGVQATLDQLQWVQDYRLRDKTINVRFRMQGVLPDANDLGFTTRGLTGNADGGTVPRTGLPYADRHHYLLADGEEVISNRHGQADRWRPMLKAINANRLADGGTAGRSSFDPERAWLNFRTARGSFDLDGGMKVAAVSRELLAFQKAVKSAGGVWTKAMREQGEVARSVARRYNEVNRALETNKEKLDDLVSIRDSIRDTAAGSFNNSPFGNGLAGLKTQLEADRNDANKMTEVLTWARKKGLNGPLYEALAQSGDLTTATQLSKMSRTEIGQYERLYSSTQSARTNLGTTAAIEATKAVREQSVLVKQVGQTLKTLDRRLENLEARIEEGAARGTKAGIQAKQRTAVAKLKGKS